MTTTTTVKNIADEQRQQTHCRFVRICITISADFVLSLSLCTFRRSRVLPRGSFAQTRTFSLKTQRKKERTRPQRNQERIYSTSYTVVALRSSRSAPGGQQGAAACQCIGRPVGGSSCSFSVSQQGAAAVSASVGQQGAAAVSAAVHRSASGGQQPQFFGRPAGGSSGQAGVNMLGLLTHVNFDTWPFVSRVVEVKMRQSGV